MLGYGLWAGLSATACQDSVFFVCEDNRGCGADGVCEAAGACSFPDEGCDSGRRYGKSGNPEVAGSCVESEGSTGVGSSGGGSSTTTGLEPPSSSSSSSTTGSVADDTGERCPADWWDCAWTHRQRLDLDVATPLQDVPLLVLLGPGRVDLSQMQSDAEDLRFVLPDGTPVPYEIESFDAEGVSTLWLRLDEVSATRDHLWLYYGNVAASGVADSTTAWGAPFVGVWHLEGEPLVDATAEGNHATPVGETDVALGQVGHGRDFIADYPRLDIEPGAALADVLAGGGTVSAWIRPRGYGTGNFGRIVQKADGDIGWLFYVGAGGRLRFAVDGFDDVWTTPEGTFELHTWSHVAVTANFTSRADLQIYVNGALVKLEQVGSLGKTLGSEADIPLTIGNRLSTGRAFDGIIDEVRLQSVVRSPEWLAFQYASMQDAVVTFGDLETIGGGA